LPKGEAQHQALSRSLRVAGSMVDPFAPPRFSMLLSPPPQPELAAQRAQLAQQLAQLQQLAASDGAVTALAGLQQHSALPTHRGHRCIDASHPPGCTRRAPAGRRPAAPQYGAATRSVARRTRSVAARAPLVVRGCQDTDGGTPPARLLPCGARQWLLPLAIRFGEAGRPPAWGRAARRAPWARAQVFAG